MTIADTESFSAENQRLKVLLEVGQAISSLMELDDLLLLIARETARVLGADRCTLFLLDEKRGELWSKVAMGEERIRLPKDKGIAGLVVTTGEALIIDDAYSRAVGGGGGLLGHRPRERQVIRGAQKNLLQLHRDLSRHH